MICLLCVVLYLLPESTASYNLVSRRLVPAVEIRRE
jgi:hypothetical protein